MPKPRGITRIHIALAGMLAALAITSSVSTTSASHAPAMQVGFTFSPTAAQALGLDPNRALQRLLVELHPDSVRIPIYWSDVEPSANSFTFSASDSLFATINSFDTQNHLRTGVIPVVGMRNIGYPELHTPPWAVTTSAPDVQTLADSDIYATYIRNVVDHYRSNPHLQMWQLENEPLDDVTSWSDGPVALDQEDLFHDRALIKTLDPVHPIMVTTYDSASQDLDREGINQREQQTLVYAYTGHPDQALRIGDALGLDLYVATQSTDLTTAPADLRVQWKASALDLWHERAVQAGKQLWVAELQAAPWPGVTGFQPDDVVRTAIAYRDIGLSGALMWGVENWLVSPAWMAAGKQAMQILGHTP